MKMNLLRCMSSVWLLNQVLKMMKIFVAIILWYSILCHSILCLSPHKRNQKVEKRALKLKPPFRSQSKILDGSKFVPTCYHCGVIDHIRSQCPKLKKEQNHVAKSLLKKPSGPKHIVSPLWCLWSSKTSLL